MALAYGKGQRASVGGACCAGVSGAGTTIISALLSFFFSPSSEYSPPGEVEFVCLVHAVPITRKYCYVDFSSSPCVSTLWNERHSLATCSRRCNADHEGLRGRGAGVPGGSQQGPRRPGGSSGARQGQLGRPAWQVRPVHRDRGGRQVPVREGLQVLSSPTV